MSKKTYRIKLRFTGPLHLSRGQSDEYDHAESVLHSDALKSALFVAVNTISGNDAAETFMKECILSSAFPFDKETFYFPKPMMRMPFQFKELNGAANESKLSKKLKKIEYISTGLFEKIVKADKEKEEFPLSWVSADGKFLSQDHSDEKVMTHAVQQRVNIDADRTEDPKPYYVDRLYFKESAGLYFLADMDEQMAKTVFSALKLLGDSGIGTDRNVGMGHFDFEQKRDVDTYSFPKVSNPNASMLLSLFLPEKEELDKEWLNRSYYLLMKRGGYISSDAKQEFLSFRKNMVYMFKEGSVLATTETLKGKIADLNPGNIRGLDHKIHRDGQAFVIPIKTELT